jgi:hypothetical protein
MSGHLGYLNFLGVSYHDKGVCRGTLIYLFVYYNFNFVIEKRDQMHWTGNWRRFTIIHFGGLTSLQGVFFVCLVKCFLCLFIIISNLSERLDQMRWIGNWKTIHNYPFLEVWPRRRGIFCFFIINIIINKQKKKFPQLLKVFFHKKFFLF